MPKNLSPDEIEAILKSGNLDELIGAVEDERLECKSAPYGLKYDHQKQELAKDVSGLANAAGGVILIGVRTERDLVHFGDELKEIRLFVQKLVNQGQYQDILRAWIYPSLQQVEIRWFPSNNDQKKGITAIFVPKQPSSRHPFLLTRFIDDSGKRVDVIFGYAERKQANVIPTSVQEIHTFIRDGKRYDELNQKYTTLEEMLGQMQQEMKTGKEPPPKSNALQFIKNRMESARIKAGLENRPSFTLAVVSVDTIEIQDIFAGRGSEIVQLIDNPPKLRSSGFDLNTGASSEIVRGELRRSVNPGKILEVWRDGTIVFAAEGDSDFLSWGKRSIPGKALYINPLVLIEATYLFGELSRRIFSKSIPGTKEVVYKLELRHMTVNSQPCYLVPGPLGSHSFVVPKAPASYAIFSINWTGSDIKSGEVAYNVVREVYRWFGMNDDEIPYTDRVDNRTIISADKIQKARE